MPIFSPLLALASALTAPQQAGPPVHHLAEIDARHVQTIGLALDLGLALDCQSRSPDGWAEVVVTDEQWQALEQNGGRARMLQPELEAYYERRIAEDDYTVPRSGINWGGGSMGGYFTFSEMLQIIDQLTAAHPNICTPRFSIGQTVEGRDLWVVKVSDNPAIDEDEPEHRLDAMHHAREPISMHATLNFLCWLLENYGTDPLATHLVDEREMFFVPCVNPDGYEYNRQIAPGGGGLWRKNRVDNGGGSFGVDVNRNYSFQWGYDNSGSSNNRDSETYRGPSPASEPETQAMEAFISSRQFRTANSAHTYSNLWLFPWGYVCNDPPQKNEFERIAQFFVEENHYVSGPICQTLYSANGDTVDYDFGVHGIWSGTVEIGGSNDGFWPPPSRIVPLIDENLRAFQRLALYAGAGLESESWNWQESLGDGDSWYEAGEESELGLTLLNAGTLATTTATILSVSADHPDVEIVDGFHDFGVIAAFGQADNLANPLRFRIADGATKGRRVVLTAQLSYDGFTQEQKWSLLIGQPSSLDLDDLEQNLGWEAGQSGDTATTGQWELADPEQTTTSGQVVQPADDHSPSGSVCAVTDGRAGSSAGTYDVDNGFTTLLSPQFDLEDAAQPLVSYWRWFSDFTQADDEFLAELSNDDGANWVEVERQTTTENQWREVVFAPSELMALSDRMRLRFRVGDDPNNSVTEALVDDLSFQAFSPDAVALWRYGTPNLGGTVRIHAQGTANRTFVLYAALGGGSFDLGGLGIWELDFSTMFRLLSGNTGTAGRYVLQGDIPNDPGLSGTEIHLQSLVLEPSGAYVSNAVDFLIQ